MLFALTYKVSDFLPNLLQFFLWKFGKLTEKRSCDTFLTYFFLEYFYILKIFCFCQVKRFYNC